MSYKLNLTETIATEDKFSTFTRLMAASDSNRVFDGGGDYTVFVPTNDAFAKIPDHKINELLNEADQTKLKALLAYHILPGKVMAGSLGAMQIRKASSGDELMFSDTNGLKVNGAGIHARNIEARNGVVHAVDTVLAPFATSNEVGAAATAGATAVTPLPAISTTPSCTTPSENSASTAGTPSMSRLRSEADTKPLI